MIKNQGFNPELIRKPKVLISHPSHQFISPKRKGVKFAHLSPDKKRVIEVVLYDQRVDQIGENEGRGSENKKQ